MSLAESPEFAEMDDPDKILVRSNGTVTYTGKDIAYQLWKLGLLTDDDGTRHDFGYRTYATWEQAAAAEPVVYGEGSRLLARTTSDTNESVPGTSFGGGKRVFNVIDVRQSYPQKVVKEAVRVLGHPEAADNSIHFSYEMVALTPAAVREIETRTEVSFGLDDEAMSKAYIEMSGRRGIGVKADEFLDVLEDAAEDAIVGRLEGGGAPADVAERARAIAVGALRYLDGSPIPQPGPGIRLRRGPRFRRRHRALPSVLRGTSEKDLLQARRPPRRRPNRARRDSRTQRRRTGGRSVGPRAPGGPAT